MVILTVSLQGHIWLWLIEQPVFSSVEIYKLFLLKQFSGKYVSQVHCNEWIAEQGQKGKKCGWRNLRRSSNSELQKVQLPNGYEKSGDTGSKTSKRLS